MGHSRGTKSRGLARLLLRCEARLTSSTGCPTELPNSTLSAKVEAMQPNTAFALLMPAVRGTPNFFSARKAVKNCVMWRMDLGGRALLQGHLARERFPQQQSLLWHCSPIPQPIMSMFSLSSASSYWAQFSLLTRKANVNVRVCVYTKKSEVHFLTFICTERGMYTTND